MQAVIFANGTSLIPESKKELIQKSPLIIAADNGAKYCEQLNIIPTALVGDLDSVSAEIIGSYEKAGVTILQAAIDKDETDLELAMLFAKEQGATEFHIFGGLGDRMDMTFTNLLMFMHPQFIDIKIVFYSEHEEILLIKDKTEFIQKKGQMISLFPLKGDAIGVQSEGLEFPLRNETMTYGVPRGVSNQIVSDEAFVSIADGALVCILSSK